MVLVRLLRWHAFMLRELPSGELLYKNRLKSTLKDKFAENKKVTKRKYLINDNAFAFLTVCSWKSNSN
jgi:hypothetical protein